MNSSKFESISLHPKCFTPFTNFLLLAVLLVVWLAPCIVGADVSVTLKLDSDDSHLVEGHKVYVRMENESYDFSKPIWQGSDSLCTIDGLENNITYYFIAKTYDEKGNTSDNSNEIKFRQNGPGSSSDSCDGDCEAGQTGSESDQAGDSNHPFTPKLGPILASESLDPSLFENSHLTSTQWQVYQEDNDFLVFDATVRPATTEIQVPRLVLKQDSSYYFIARHIDVDSKALEWTPKQNYINTDTDIVPKDADNDGIPDEQEADPQVDLDADGTPDAIQENMRCIKTTNAAEHFSLSLAGNHEDSSIEAIETIGVDELPIQEDITTAPKMPFGLLNVRLKVENSGDQAQLIIYLPPSVQTFPKLWYFYDPINGWKDASSSITPSNKKGALTLKVTDGGAGDVDGVENGIIVCQSGPASSPPADIGNGNASYACFINSLF
jgi:hypothetical protein